MQLLGDLIQTTDDPVEFAGWLSVAIGDTMSTIAQIALQPHVC
jgi:dolichol kinase